jgi:hypothetical protein
MTRVGTVMAHYSGILLRGSSRLCVYVVEDEPFPLSTEAQLEQTLLTEIRILFVKGNI